MEPGPQPERVAIVGSRDYPTMWEVALYVRQLPEGTTVISGGARGVDHAAVLTARREGFRVEVFAADWNRFGKAAGPIRNAEVVKAADRIVAFWDGHSKGTADAITKARAAGKPVEIFRSPSSRSPRPAEPPAPLG